ncbi:hypothetical protein C8R48DRAFT_767789 [Suillus tomentosus]|nr:hypothetical protein C8R48DRAFT_767789 [Suillus tomentosus]
MKFFGDTNSSALDVVAFVWFPPPAIESGKTFLGVLWILGDYVEGLSDIQATFQDIRKVVSEALCTI